MLVLSRKATESIVISQDGKPIATVKVVSTDRGVVKLGIDAEQSIDIDREEIARTRRPAIPGV